MNRELIEQAQGCGAKIGLVMADALCVDAPFLAWLKHDQGIDAMVRLPPKRRLYEDFLGRARAGQIEWSSHRYVRTIHGRKTRHPPAPTSRPAAPRVRSGHHLSQRLLCGAPHRRAP